jgi:hypothetical protein
MELLKVKMSGVLVATPVAPMAGLLETVVEACAGTANKSTAIRQPSQIARTDFLSIVRVETNNGLQFPKTPPAVLQTGINGHYYAKPCCVVKQPGASSRRRFCASSCRGQRSLGQIHTNHPERDSRPGR